ncbi:MAG: hypothetical protein ACE5LV_09475 [Candidatus Aminicenantales bacterium]
MKRGFSLLESLLSLFVFLLIILFSLEGYSQARRHFFKLKEDETSNISAFAALDRMRKDLLDAGFGLIEPMRLGLLEAVTVKDGHLIILSLSEELGLRESLVEGQQRVMVQATAHVKKGHKVCVHDSEKGEVTWISQVGKGEIVFASPLRYAYQEDDVHMLLLREIVVYHDRTKESLRRKVNASPAQPLLEDAKSFRAEYFDSENLARISFRLNRKPEEEYGITVFAKNPALEAIQKH